MAKEQTEAKKQYNKIGLGLFCFCIITIITQVIAIFIYFNYTGVKSITLSNFIEWIINSGTQYIIAFPIFYLLVRKSKKEEVEKKKIGIKNFFIFLMEGFGLMYIGNVIGSVLSIAISFFASGKVAANPVVTATANSNNVFIKILFIVILAPIFEELIFRKTIIDRTSKYGEKFSIIFSSLAFALFHMNLFQFFYAFGIGLIFGYVYIKTREIKYSMAMHATINLFGGIIAPAVLSLFYSNVYQITKMSSINELINGGISIVLFLIYVVIYFGVSIIGMVYFFSRVKNIKFEEKEEQIPKNKVFTTCYLNVFYVLYFAICFFMTISQLI